MSANLSPESLECYDCLFRNWHNFGTREEAAAVIQRAIEKATAPVRRRTLKDAIAMADNPLVHVPQSRRSASHVKNIITALRIELEKLDTQKCDQ